MKRILLVVPPNVHMLDLGGPMQVFGSLSGLGIAEVALHCIGPMKAPTSFQGLGLDGVQPLPATLARGDRVVVIGAKFDFDAAPTADQTRIADWLRSVVAPRLDAVRLASVCTGAFLLGAAGLLDGRSCTTHHDHLARLQQRHPAARVLSNRMVVDDGAIVTSAGVSAGIDLALHMIADDFGAATAVRVARENVVPFRRLSEDPALDAALRYRDHHHAAIHAVQDFLTDQPASTLPYDALASRFALSYRHLARLFQQACGITVKQYQQQLRLALARRLLRDSDWAVEIVAERCGFASPQAFRAAWRQEEALSPSRWRADAAQR